MQHHRFWTQLRLLLAALKVYGHVQLFWETEIFDPWSRISNVFQLPGTKSRAPSLNQWIAGVFYRDSISDRTTSWEPSPLVIELFTDLRLCGGTNDNDLSGELPEVLGSLDAIYYLDANNFTGAAPFCASGILAIHRVDCELVLCPCCLDCK